ncbi:DinB family protein [Flavisolibacter tropicus]|uniref:DinB-like domain-containing protein n=1 Tax=Flavisolibacter tropicus TaxID=1492898 RepID=A0A172U048_9BACT|nr:DinB family protein [Flavisolibacter tropicus]ANE52690.1 hypothetical protein SY85_21620 [Flavisolibacter tropicus]
MKRTLWLNRTFHTIEDSGLLPDIIERLEGTPARLEEKIRSHKGPINNKPLPDKWSVKQEIGHLIDLEWLGQTRIEQLKAGLPELVAADMGNRKTQEAHHDDKSFDELLEAFRQERSKLVASFRSLSDADLEMAPFHPRLKRPMKAVDLAYFIAEHDDHHLAQITWLLQH